MLAAGAPKRPVPVDGAPKRPLLAAGAPNKLDPAVLAGAPNSPVPDDAAGAPNKLGPAEVVGAVRENAGVDAGALTPKPGLSEEPRVEAPKGVVLIPNPWVGAGGADAGRRDCLANSLKHC